MEGNKGNRDGFSSSLAVFFATLGSAVGLGNIWKFPYLTGENGGGAFLFVYLLCILVIGIPVMIAEFYIGKSTRKNIMGAIKSIKPNNRLWRVIALGGIFAAFFIMFFYSAVGGWVYAYVFNAVTGKLSGVNVNSASAIFESTKAGSFQPIMWQIIVVIVVSTILVAGVKNGIEKITKTLMPVLFILILICDVRALTLDNSFEGIHFLFNVNFSKITPMVIMSAMGLAFFKLSLGMGTMVTYSSYFTKDTNLITTSAKVAIADTLVSLLAGIAIFPAVFAFGMEPNSGQGLLFKTIPLVFSRLPGGNILLAAFFILAAIAATTAMISMAEVVVAFLSEEFAISRTRAVCINATIIILIGTMTTLSLDQSSIFSKIVILHRNLFDLFDYLSSNYLLPLGGLLITILVGHFISKDGMRKVLSNDGKIKNDKFITVIIVLIRYVAPTLLLFVFLNSINIIKF